MTPAGDSAPSLQLLAGVATVRLRRPAQHNRIDPDDIPVLREHLAQVAAEPSAFVLILTGTGDASFSSGYTVDAIVDRLDRSFEDLLDAVERFPLPTICALNGSVYGGATDLALCCDFRIGIKGSRMFMPAAKFGLHYYPGGLRRSVAALGATQAKRMMLTAQTIEADEMLRIGFLTELVEPSALEPAVARYVEALSECEPAVVKSMKRQIDALAAGDAALGADRSYYEASLRSAELRRRVAALVNKS